MEKPVLGVQNKRRNANQPLTSQHAEVKEQTAWSEAGKLKRTEKRSTQMTIRQNFL